MKKLREVLAVLLCAVMLCAWMPLQVFAEPGDGPAAANITVVNRTLELGLGPAPHVKGMLEATYDYTHSDAIEEGESSYQWYASNTQNEGYTKLAGINTKTIILLDSYVGKYLKCEVTVQDQDGNVAEPVMSAPTAAPVQATSGNPLTDWFYEAKYGVSHHFLSPWLSSNRTPDTPEEKWEKETETWDEFVSRFDAEKYAEQLSKTTAKFVIITLGQNAAEYCAPNEVYDQALRDAGLLAEGEKNPKTVSYENDLPMKMINALEPYGIKVILYLPSNPPHTAHWVDADEDFLVTEQALKSVRSTDGPASQESKKIHCEMVKWWSLHYGDRIAGWWFDGMYAAARASQNDMSLEYNISTLANAAKAGNPYNIITFNHGLAENRVYFKGTAYHDYTAGEVLDFNYFPASERWTSGTTDCQNFLFGVLGTGKWGTSGLAQTADYVETQYRTATSKNYVIATDIKVNRFGEISPEQLALHIDLKARLQRAASQVNLALGKTAVASNEHSASYGASRATDGNMRSRWATSSETTHSLEVDLAEKTALNKMVIKALAGVEYPVAVRAIPFKLSYLDESENWVEFFHSGTEEHTNNNRYVLKVPPITAENLAEYVENHVYQSGVNVNKDTGEVLHTEITAYFDTVETTKIRYDLLEPQKVSLIEFELYYEDPVLVKDIQIDQASAEVKAGEDVQLNAIFTPGHAANKGLAWSSSDETVATVENGLVTGVSEGAATITATTADGGFTASCEVAVQAGEPQPISVTGVTLNAENTSMTTGEILTLTAAVEPADATNKAVVWNSNDHTVATVMDGVVTANAAGTATISVTTEDGGFTANCEITVSEETNQPVPVTGVELAPSELALKINESAALAATVHPAEADNRNLGWSSSDPVVAEVYSGVVVAKATGVVSITVTTEDGGITDSCTVTVTEEELTPVPVTGIVLSETTLELALGESGTLSAVVQPEEATNKAVVWSSGDPAIATVSDGYIRALAEGTATITATTVDGSFTDNCVVTVVDARPQPVPVIGIALSAESQTLKKGGSFTLTPSVLPEDATNQGVTWGSDNTDVAEVTNGVVIAKAAGSATITATTDEGDFTASCLVTVEEDAPPAVKVVGINMEPTGKSVVVGERFQLSPVVLPQNADNKAITWASTDASVASVEGGRVTALQAGAADIIATTADGGFTATCQVSVTKPEPPKISVTGVSVTPAAHSMKTGETLQLTASVQPSNADNKGVGWTSGAANIASVDSAGRVTAHKAGTATVTVTTEDGGKTAAATITVTQAKVPVTGITLNMTAKNLKKGKSVQLRATVRPADATDKKVSWKSSNTKVATVSTTGKVSAKKNGTATITTTAGGRKATVKIQVGEKHVSVSKVKLDRSRLTLNVKGSWTLKANISPAKASNKKILWTSSDTRVAGVSANGKVTGKATGKAVITATSREGGRIAKCTVTVKPAVQKVKLSKTKQTLSLNSTTQLKVTITPKAAGGATIQWESSNPRIATISSNGKVTAVAKGKTTITAKIGGKRVACQVTVK